MKTTQDKKLKKRGPKKRNPKNAGRKLFDGKNEDIVVQKLEQVFAIDGTDEEACSYADISKAALYAYQKKHPKFLEQKLRLKERPVLKARQTAVQKLGESYQNAMDYLSRKRKNEFSARSELTGAYGEPIKMQWEDK